MRVVRLLCAISLIALAATVGASYASAQTPPPEGGTACGYTNATYSGAPDGSLYPATNYLEATACLTRTGNKLVVTGSWDLPQRSAPYGISGSILYELWNCTTGKDVFIKPLYSNAGAAEHVYHGSGTTTVTGVSADSYRSRITGTGVVEYGGEEFEKFSAVVGTVASHEGVLPFDSYSACVA